MSKLPLDRHYQKRGGFTNGCCGHSELGRPGLLCSRDRAGGTVMRLPTPRRNYEAKCTRHNRNLGRGRLFGHECESHWFKSFARRTPAETEPRYTIVTNRCAASMLLSGWSRTWPTVRRSRSKTKAKAGTVRKRELARFPRANSPFFMLSLGSDPRRHSPAPCRCEHPRRLQRSCPCSGCRKNSEGRCLHALSQALDR